ncbi:hypothetical protein QLX08_000961 [Tetragonisca angustula]|uniref:Uncharacterized protein n=1 Tax=Tetragonisca angustula TaxID=166442 RepID=A0AAW1AGY6_9HYME
MLKFSTYTVTWISTILLLIVPVSKTENYNNVNIHLFTCHYHNYNYLQDCESLRNSNDLFVSFSYVLQDFISVLLNGTCMYDSLSLTNRFESSTKDAIDDVNKLPQLLTDKLKNIRIHSERLIITISLKDTINRFLNNTLVSNNVLSKSIEGNSGIQSYQVDYRWRRRALCTTSENEKYFTGSLLENKENTGKEKTLLDYDEPVSMNDIDDPDSLKTHVRVKRSKSESDPVSAFRYQRDYLKDLANSFPRDSYDSIGENLYDDDVSFDTKREIKSEDKQCDDSLDENGPIVVPSYLSEDKSDVSDIISPRSDIRDINTGKRNIKFIGGTRSKETVSLQEPLNDVIANQKSYEDPEVEKLLDSMLAVELVRKKRDDCSKVHNERNLGEENSSDLQSTIDKKEESNEKERSILSRSRTVEKHLNPPSSSVANVKADLLRIRRKARKRSRDETNKLKQKKKQIGKKHDVSKISLRSDRSRMSRKSKANKAISEGNLKMGIANLAAKKDNGNNFRRRSEKSEKSIDRIDSENDPSKLKRSKKKFDDDTSRFSLVGRDSIAAGGADDSKAATNENLNTFATENKEQKAFEETEKSMTSPQNTKLRTKRKRHTESNHGFLNKEEELKYYENIREPGTEIDRCIDGDENQLAMINEMDPNRAVRSIDEVKKLAKQLVTKVNELQNYINVDETSGKEEQEKKIKTRAIDDLCSNVSTSYDAFKETPEVVQKCVPTNRGGSVVKIVEKKVNPVNDHKLVNIPSKRSLEKKRSVTRRVGETSPRTSKTIREENEVKSGRKWGKWTDWSSCSTTCGKGRQIRWRYCLRDCSTAETEMEEKACQLPACPPGKFLGIF